MTSKYNCKCKNKSNWQRYWKKEVQKKITIFFYYIKCEKCWEIVYELKPNYYKNFWAFKGIIQER